LKGHWFDCLDESEEPVDEDPDSHGTAMVALLLRLLPNADIYVFRVARDAEGLSTARESIANVIGSEPRYLYVVDTYSRPSATRSNPSGTLISYQSLLASRKRCFR